MMFLRIYWIAQFMLHPLKTASHGTLLLLRMKKKKQKLAELKDEGNQEHILTAPACIVVCVDTEKSPTRFVEDGVAATENILLAAHDFGMGSVYVTGFKPSKPEIAEQIRSILNIPDNILPISILPIGYVDDSEKLHEKRVIDADEITHSDGW